MKPSQKLKIEFERYVVIVRFDELDSKLLPLARKLELSGDKFGPVVTYDGEMCICMRYADKSRDGIPDEKIFGYPANEFLAKQYK